MADNKLNNVYKKYFDLIDDFFGSIKHHLGDYEDSHIDLGHKIASYPLISDLVLDAIEDLDEEVEKFWRENAKTVFDIIRQQSTLKCLYSGDITPFVLEKFVKRTSLYIDTVLLPDPLYNLSVMQKQIIIDRKYYLNKLIRHVFNVWKLRDLILADTNEKIVVILPINLDLISSGERDRLLSEADGKFTQYTNSIFGTSLSAKDECFDFLAKYVNSESIFSAMRNRDLLPNVFKTQGGITSFLSSFIGTEKYSIMQGNTVGWNFSMYVSSQFIRVQEHKFFCNRLLAEPIYDYELPWFFFNHEMGGLDMDAAISNALQRETFDWIGNSEIPLVAFRRFREENKLDYMRSILRKGITDLKAKNDENLIVVSEQLEKNLKEAFIQQKSEIGELKKEASLIAKKEIPIAIGGCLVGFIPAVGNVVSVVSAGRDIKNSYSKIRQLKQEVVVEEGSLVNLLVKSYDRRKK